MQNKKENAQRPSNTSGALDLLPQAAEAERAVIGSMILDNEMIPEVMDIVSAADFVDLQCALLYDTIISLWVEMHSSGTVVGVLVVQGKLTDTGKWDDDLAAFQLA